MNRLLAIVNRVMGKHLPPEQPTGRVCAQRWISVKEGAPKEDGPYIVALYHGCEYYPSSLWAEWDSDEGWQVFGFDGSPKPVVTHWMPLPEPPEYPQGGSPLPPSLERYIEEGL